MGYFDEVVSYTFRMVVSDLPPTDLEEIFQKNFKVEKVIWNKGTGSIDYIFVTKKEDVNG
jgi:hypothetical protein